MKLVMSGEELGAIIFDTDQAGDDKEKVASFVAPTGWDQVTTTHATSFSASEYWRCMMNVTSSAEESLTSSSWVP